MALHFNTLLTRTLTAAIFVTVLISAISYSYLSFTILFFIIALWGLSEFFLISKKSGARPFKFIAYACSVLLLISGFIQNAGLSALSYQVFYAESLICLSLLFVAALFSKKSFPLKDVAYTVTGIAYVIIPFVLLNFIACIDKSNVNEGELNFNSPYNHHIVLGLFFLIWANDSYAYLVGSLIGKHKLFLRISPAKTWEGTIGAALLTVASSYLIAKWFTELHYVHWIVIAIIVSVAGTVGDLFESMLKRQVGIKDSGKLMPGHGGILDRFDSLLLIVPFVYLYLSFVFA